MISDGNKEKAKLVQYDLVHTLGNLTLSGYNSQLGNLSFEKNVIENKSDAYVGYKNGMFLNKELKSKDTWKAKDILDRSHQLIEVIADYVK